MVIIPAVRFVPVCRCFNAFILLLLPHCIECRRGAELKIWDNLMVTWTKTDVLWLLIQVTFYTSIPMEKYSWMAKLQVGTCCELIWMCARLAQFVRSLSTNQQSLGSIHSPVECLTSGDLLSPHRPWTGTLSRWSSLDILSEDLKQPTHLSIRVG